MRPTPGSLEMDALCFPKLNGQNYASWAVHMRSTLQSKYLWSVVKGKEVCPTTPDETDTPSTEDLAQIQTLIDKWESKDEAAQGLMYSSSDESQWPHVADSKTAMEMWNAWKQVHQTNQQSINIFYHI